MRPPVYSVALFSASALAYEILLIRLFSIIQWHHFAYMIISLALLGYGASGMFLSLTRNWLSARFGTALLINGLLFAVSSVACFLLGQAIPFNPLAMSWEFAQSLYLLGLYLLLALPFFSVANCIGLILVQFPAEIPRIYGFDLLGAGTGALAIIALLFTVTPMTALLMICALGLIATAIGLLELRLRPRPLAALLIAAALALVPLLHHREFPLQLSPYKSLSRSLTVIDREVVEEHSSPLGLLSVVNSPTVPFRYAPGLSLNTSLEPPPQIGIFIDGDNLTVMTRDNGQRDTFAYTDFFTSALPYHLLDRPEVLILGAGGDAEILQARYFNAATIDAVELNPQLAALVDRYATFTGGLYRQPNVRRHIAEARGFVATSRRPYDLIQLALLDAFSASSAGLYALSESYLYTTEAIIDYLGKLSPGGLLAITRWNKIPPRDGLKLFATVVTALESQGKTDANLRLGLIRSWKTNTLLVKNGIFSATEIATLQDFCTTRGFDLGYYPGIVAAEANLHNMLDRPYFFTGTNALLDPAQRVVFSRGYKFNIEPASDDRPYFFNFFKWSALPELLSLRSRGGLPLVEQGYLILVVTLFQAIAVSSVLILVPLRYHSRTAARAPPTLRREQRWVACYFFSLGLAFLFIEIAFIQKFMLFLRHPLYAVSVVICGFLVFSGLGSHYSARLTKGTGSSAKCLLRAVCAIAAVSLLYLYLLPVIFQLVPGLLDPLRIGVALALIAPLAFAMGIPFPLGLSRLSYRAPELIPWAWGINGCASVISAVLATVLATHIGFRGVVVIAVCCYFLAALIYPDKGEGIDKGGGYKG